MEIEDSIRISDAKCERVVLGTMMMLQNTASEMMEYLDKDCFYVFDHQEIFTAISGCMDDGDIPDLIHVCSRLNRMASNVKPAVVAEVCNSVAYQDGVGYAMRLRELSIRRKLWMLGHELIAAGSSEVRDLDEVQQGALDNLTNIFQGNSSKVRTLTDYVAEMYEHIKQNMALEGGTTGTPTGFHALDIKGGLQGGSLYIVAGETSQGKTSWAFTIAANAMQKGVPIAAFSLEMTGMEIAIRITSGLCGINSSYINYSKSLTGDELRRIDNATAKMKSDLMYFDERSNVSLDSILTSIRSLKAKHGIKGVIIDYLQILNVNTKGSSPEQLMGETARKLKNIAKELDIFVIALSQLNRDKENPMPTLNRLRDSGQIGEAADAVMFVYRPEYYGKNFPEPFQDADTKDMAMIHVAKGRNIGTFKFLVRFDGATTHFSDVNDSYERRRDGEHDDAPF